MPYAVMHGYCLSITICVATTQLEPYVQLAQATQGHANHGQTSSDIVLFTENN